MPASTVSACTLRCAEALTSTKRWNNCSATIRPAQANGRVQTNVASEVVLRLKRTRCASASRIWRCRRWRSSSAGGAGAKATPAPTSGRFTAVNLGNLMPALGRQPPLAYLTTLAKKKVRGLLKHARARCQILQPRATRKCNAVHFLTRHSTKQTTHQSGQRHRRRTPKRDAQYRFQNRCAARIGSQCAEQCEEHNRDAADDGGDIAQR